MSDFKALSRSVKGLTVLVTGAASGMGFVEYGYEKRALKQDGKYYDDVLMVRFLEEGLS